MAIQFLNAVDVTGEVQGTSLDINGAADISGVLTQGGHIEMASAKRIRWGAGDAMIAEGISENYALEFSTYNGSSMTEALRLSGDNSATFTGSLTIPEYIVHSGDTNTYFGFSAADTFKLHVGGEDVLRVNGGATTDEAAVTILCGGGTNATNIGLLLNGNTNGETLKVKMMNPNDSGSVTGAGILSYEPDGDTFNIGQSTTHNNMAMSIDNSENVTFAANIGVGGTVLGTSAKFGRDADNLIDFASTDNQIRFRVNGGDEANMTNAFFYPHSNDGMALGQAATAWSDLFLASGAVIGFNNGDVTLTHSSNTLTVAGGTLATAALTATTGTFSGNITANGDIIGDDGTNITNINRIESDSFAADADNTTTINMGATQIECLVADTDIFQVGEDSFTFDPAIKTSIHKRLFAKTTNVDGNFDGDVVFFGSTTSMTAGKLYYYNSSGNWALADADAASTSTGLLGVALGTASDTNGMLLRGMVTVNTIGGTEAVGDILYVALAAGDVTKTVPSGTGDIVRVVGYCLDANNGQIWFNPDGAFVEIA